jgi:4-hydroxybenzoate polyprenyltransferase
MNNSIQKINLLLTAARPVQWLKNLTLYAAITFWGTLFVPDIFWTVTKAVLVFCGLSSAMYLINDSIDAPKDRIHPLKKHRPIASGAISTNLALFTSFLLITLLLPLSFYLDKFFFILALGYVFLQFAYSLFFRQVIILDALTVALGFIFRVYAGALVVDAPISSWLIIATIGLSLLLAFGKRRSERTLLKEENIETETRLTLKHYPENLLDSMISISASITILSYVLFTFQISPTNSVLSLTGFLPTTLLKPKWMMLTIPLVIYGVARYLFVIYEKKEGESPAQVLMSDKPLLATIVLWLLGTIIVLYGIGS